MNINWGWRSIVGLLLVILAGISLVIDLAGIVQIWVLREPVTNDAITTLDLLNRTLNTTAQGLGIAKASLQSVTGTIGALQDTVASAAGTIENASRAVSSLSGIVGGGLSNTVTAALGTLEAVENTTRTVDEVLGGLSQLPFLNIQYDSNKPLSGGVSDLTDQLKQVPNSLSDLEKNLTTSGSSLDTVGDDARKLADSLGSVESELAKLVAVIEQYEQQVKAFQGTVQNLRANIVNIIWGVVLFLTFILFWLGVVMAQTLFKGLAWMGIRLDSPKQVNP